MMCDDLLNYPETEVCGGCEREMAINNLEIKNYKSQGHTDHCARRLVWGDGECECDMRFKE